MWEKKMPSQTGAIGCNMSLFVKLTVNQKHWVDRTQSSLKHQHGLSGVQYTWATDNRGRLQATPLHGGLWGTNTCKKYCCYCSWGFKCFHLSGCKIIPTMTLREFSQTKSSVNTKTCLSIFNQFNIIHFQELHGTLNTQITLLHHTGLF